MRKIFVSLLLILLLPALYLFANGGTEGQAGYSVYYIPSNVANNQNVMIELTEAKSVNISNVGTSFAEATQSIYPEATKNLVIGCLMDTLKDPDGNRANVDVTIRSTDPTGFFFKKDGNEAKTVPFEIEVCCVAFYKGNNSTNYSTKKANEKMTVSSMGTYSKKIEYTTTRNYWIVLTETYNYDETTSFQNNGPAQYTISLSPTRCTETKSNASISDSNADYPNLIKYYYICLKLANNPNLEEGLYTASFTISATFDKQEIGASSSTVETINETVSIKGYVGEKPEVSDSTYSFFVSPGANTYYMDLATVDGETIPAYDIARLQFNYTYLNPTSTDPASDSRRRKYIIYISPTSSVYSDGKYAFRRNGTEAQLESFGNTVEYDLYLETSSGNYELISSSGHDYTGNGNNSASSAAAHYTSGMIGGAGQATTIGNSTGGDHTYYLYPVYDRLQTATGTNSRYKETWTLDQHIYLKINSDQTEIYEGNDSRMHQTGSYTSVIYFTVVTN